MKTSGLLDGTVDRETGCSFPNSSLPYESSAVYSHGPKGPNGCPRGVYLHLCHPFQPSVFHLSNGTTSASKAFQASGTCSHKPGWLSPWKESRGPVLSWGHPPPSPPTQETQEGSPGGLRSSVPGPCLAAPIAHIPASWGPAPSLPLAMGMIRRLVFACVSGSYSWVISTPGAPALCRRLNTETIIV